MNILFISQCSGRALSETRRILDQFAERRGERTWQTPITQEGLNTVRRLLRKTARKNSAVACHWIHGIDHSELVWIVGNAGQFNAQGATPTNSTTREVLRRSDENDWHNLQKIGLLATLAALFHDLGKASEAFQKRIRNNSREKNLYRHEWLSLRILEAMVDSDSDAVWLNRLVGVQPEDVNIWLLKLQQDGLQTVSSTPFIKLPPLAKAIGWLIVSHHRLPVLPRSNEDGFQTSILDNVLDQVTADWNQLRDSTNTKQGQEYWSFPLGLPLAGGNLLGKVKRTCQKLLGHLHPAHGDWLTDPYILHLSRLSLMLADHAFSSMPPLIDHTKAAMKTRLFANTDPKTGHPKQFLDEHLLGVAQLCQKIVRFLPRVSMNFPRLARIKALRKRSTNELFRWQDKAAEVAEGLRDRSTRQGAFIVNLASTGCGKTLANARMMYGLADQVRGMRCAFALGLRVLTQQTGREYRERLHLENEDVAIRVGGAASRELQDLYQKQAETSGSESAQPLFPDNGHTFYEGNVDSEPALKHLLSDPHARALLIAPFLVCTIDHLITATEGTRAGHQIAPMLRLLSGDLVLDELDDYDINDLPAVARLMNWAGMLGCRVLISSATLPPSLVQGMFDAYCHGIDSFQKNRGERPGEKNNVCCLWVDEFDTQQTDCLDAESFSIHHANFVRQRCSRLEKAMVRRRGELIPFACTKKTRKEVSVSFAEKIREVIPELHQAHHEKDPQTGKRISFGLVRMANINPLFDVALALHTLGAPSGLQIHLCVYHSQFPLFIRAAIENQLDQALDRHKPLAVFSIPSIRRHLGAPGSDHVFLVLGSPVTEVGRDHDYDWAVVEPSSMRSLIQVVGRVKRHRLNECLVPNVRIFDRNIRCIVKPDEAAYCWPGFENREFLLANHCLDVLLPESERAAIDSRPRIMNRPPSELQPRQRLSDLEHVRLQRLFLSKERKPLTDRQKRAGASDSPPLGAFTWWAQPHSMLTGVLQREQPFRRTTIPQLNMVLLPTEDEDDLRLSEVRLETGFKEAFIPVERSLNHRIDLPAHPDSGIQIWGESNYLTVLKDLSEALELDLSTCAYRFGSVTLPESTNGWRFHPSLGFSDCSE